MDIKWEDLNGIKGMVMDCTTGQFAIWLKEKLPDGTVAVFDHKRIPMTYEGYNKTEDVFCFAGDVARSDFEGHLYTFNREGEVENGE